jgi:hypothetical protein
MKLNRIGRVSCIKTKIERYEKFLLLGLILSAASMLQAAPYSLQGSGYGINVSYFHGVNDIKRGTNETWDDVVNSFNVNTFVADVVVTGAPYVVFSIGQSNGYYCSPNTTFNNYTGCRTGEYTSTRDLVLEVANALNAKGIKMFVYLASVGPSGATSYVRADGTSADPVRGLDVDGQGRSTIFQTRFQEMVKEWSTRWGTKVAGWWLDGCWVGGYTENPVQGYGTSGPQNLENLIAACKFGNSEALVGCNPSSGRYSGMSKKADYLCGEDEWLNKYPTAQYVYTDGAYLQWNTTIYLGTSWGDGSTRFSNEQIAAYVKNVKDRAGSVMLDIGIYRNGSLSTAQKSQMGYVYSRVRSNVALTSYTDLARYKSVWMLNSVGTELEPNGAGGYLHYAGYGNDGVSDAAVAIPGGAYDWQYVVDLGANSTVRRALITFPKGLFATQFKVEGTITGTSWVALASYSLSSSQITLNNAQTVAYNIMLPLNSSMQTPRFVRLRAITPNAPNQTGLQMGVQAFELYAN